MPRRVRVTGRELIRALQRADFVVVRVKGSHHFLEHPDGRTTVVPVHAGESIGIGLMIQILRDCEMSDANLRALM